MKSVAIIILAVLLTSCATTGSKKFRGMFREDIAQSRESVMVGGSTQTINDLSMILEMDPKNAEARFLRAVAYQKTGEFEKAAGDYGAIIARDPDNAKAHFNLGMIYAYKLRDVAAALRHLDAFITLNGDDPRSVQAAKLMLSLDAQAAAEPSGVNGMIRDVLAQRGAIRAESKEESSSRIKALKGYVRTSPDSPKLYFALGKSYENAERLSDAVRSYEKALEISPTYALCHHHLGKLLQRAGRTEDARIHAFKASLFSRAGEES